MTIPVVIAANGLGTPIRPVEKNAPEMQVAENGLGIPVVISDLGAPFILRGAAPAPVVAFIAGPQPLRVYQRTSDTGGAFDKGAAQISVSVDVFIPVESLEYRLRDADQPAATLVDWTIAAGASAAGVHDLTITAPARLGDYLLDVRANADPMTVISSSNRFGVGAVILVAGQSQAARTYSFAASGALIADMAVSPYGRVYVPHKSSDWLLPADDGPFNSVFAPEFLLHEQERRGVSCGYAGRAEGDTAISDWRPGTALLNELAAVVAATGGFEGLYWFQGGTDATTGTTAAAYEADLDAILNDLSGRNSRPYHAVITAMATRRSGAWSAVQRIRRAAQAVASRRANAIYAEPRLANLTDDIHQTQSGNIQIARAVSRHFAAIEGGAKAVGPTLSSAVAKGPELTLTFDLEPGASLVGGGNWPSRIGVYPNGATPSAGRLPVSFGSVVGNAALLRLATDPGGPVDVYVYDHPDPNRDTAEADALTDDVTSDGIPAGRQVVPSTTGPVVSAYEAPPSPLEAVYINFVSGSTTAKPGMNIVKPMGVNALRSPDYSLITGAGDASAIKYGFEWGIMPPLNSNSGSNFTNQTISAGSAFDGTTIYAADIFAAAWFTNPNYPLTHILTGLVPGEEYEIAIVGSRTGAEATRTTTFTSGSVSVILQPGTVPPQLLIMKLSADAQGEIRISQAFTGSGAAHFSYISGLSVTLP